jgi:hypothetical protein
MYRPLSTRRDHKNTSRCAFEPLDRRLLMAAVSPDIPFAEAAGTGYQSNFLSNAAPAITTHPSDTSVIAFNSATFTASASGTPAPTVQWQFSPNNGLSFINIGGATSETLTLESVNLSMQNWLYRARFTNSLGAATTNAATLNVMTLPHVTQSPQSQTVAHGAHITLTTAASATPAATVQWQNKIGNGAWTNIAGATSESLELHATQSMNNSLYRAIWTNAAGSTSSTVGLLTVITLIAPTTPDLVAASDTGISNTDNLTNATDLVFSASLIQAGGVTVELLRDGVPIATSANQIGFIASNAPAGSHTYAIRQSLTGVTGPTSGAITVNVDRTAPNVQAAFDFETSHSISYQFGEPSARTLTPADVVVHNHMTHQNVPDSAISFTQTSTGATLSFPGLPAGLMDGNYEAHLTSGSVVDAAGNAAENFLDFYVFAGDANRDRAINILDFGRLAANFNRPGTFSQGDFTYNGIVNVQDFSLLASRFNSTMPAARPAAGARPASPFATSRIRAHDLLADPDSMTF